jgi:hypothetical protein
MVNDAEIPIADTKIATAVTHFLDNLPEFNIRTTSIYTALKQPKAFKDIADGHRGAVINHLKILQRVQAISPVPEAVPALMKANLTSAFHVAEKPESTFLRAFGPSLGEETARQVCMGRFDAFIPPRGTIVEGLVPSAATGARFAPCDPCRAVEQLSSRLTRLVQSVSRGPLRHVRSARYGVTRAVRGVSTSCILLAIWFSFADAVGFMCLILMRAARTSQSRRFAIILATIALVLPRTATRAEAPEPLPLVVVSGNPAALHLKPPLNLAILSPFSRQSEVCATFTVSARKDMVPEVVVTSTGLGRAMLFDPAKPGNRLATWKLNNVTPAGSTLCLCISSDLVPNTGDSIDGKILVLASDRKPVEVPIKLDRPSSDPPSSALLWFLALIVPALLTYWIARLTAYRTERNKQVGRFVKYRDLAYLDLRDFFRTHYATLHKDNTDDQQFAIELEKALREQRIWSRIPDQERAELTRRLRLTRRKETRILLARQFPDWKQEIEHPGE